MKILVVGCGRVGSELANTLSLRGDTVTVIDQNPATFAHLGPTFKGKTLVGIGFDRDVLLRAGIERVDGLAAVTGSDEANAIIARLASQIFHVPRVVARVYDPRQAEIYRRLGLQTISPVTWGVNRMVEVLSLSGLNVVCSLGSGEVDLLETEIPPTLAGRTVQELVVPTEVHVVAISRGGKTFLPMPTTVLQAGDLVHLVVLGRSTDRLQALLNHG
ncbi:MAG: NAD-binding protein [Caldilineaceae bacterium]